MIYTVFSDLFNRGLPRIGGRSSWRTVLLAALVVQLDDFALADVLWGLVSEQGLSIIVLLIIGRVDLEFCGEFVPLRGADYLAETTLCFVVILRSYRFRWGIFRRPGR